MASVTSDQPLVSVDVVALTWDRGLLRALVAPRKFEPFLGVPALPGVLLAPGERVEQAAYRALATKADVAPHQVRWLGRGSFFDESNRDPRGATISLTTVAVLSQTVGDLDGVRQMRLPRYLTRLPFDHTTILHNTLGSVVTGGLWRDMEMTRAILGPSFQTSSVAALHRLLDIQIARGNLFRWLSGRPELVAAKGSSTPQGVGRPSAWWHWRDEDEDQD